MPGRPRDGGPAGAVVHVRPVAAEHPDAVGLRRLMYQDLAAVYPEATAAVEEHGGLPWLEERRCLERRVHALVLETGTAQPAALALYSRLGFQEIPAFPPHAPDPDSWFGLLEL